MNYGRVNSGSERLDATLQEKSFTPDKFPFAKYATTYGIDGFSWIQINAPENFSAENIKKDVTIAGVTGTYEGTTTPSTLGTADIKPTAFPTVKNASDDGVDGYSTVTVQAPDNLVAGNIKKDVVIAGVTGTYEGSGGGSGQLDDRTKFWMRGIQNKGMRFDAEGHLLPFVMLKEYWPDKLQGYEISTNPKPNKLVMSDYCCAYLYLDRVELPEGKGVDGVTDIPTYAFCQSGPFKYGDAEFKYMTVTGGEAETYKFGDNAFTGARLSDVPDINYYQNTISRSLFSAATFYSCNVPEGITTISAGSFSDLTVDSDSTLRLPSTLTTITGYGVISGQYTKHINIMLKSTTPPTLDNASGIRDYVGQIIVPAGTLEAYRTATNWSALADKMVEATENAGTTEAGA